MHIGYTYHRKITFRYTVLFTLVELIAINSVPMCIQKMELITWCRISWYSIYILALYNANTPCTLYFLWFVDFIRWTWWFASILIITNSFCIYNIYHIIISTLSAMLFFFNDVNKLMYSELDCINTPHLHYITIYDIFIINQEPEAQPIFTNILYQSETTCSICFEIINRTTVPNIPCHHVFHIDCLSTWLQYQRNCPLCRLPIR